MIEKFLDMFQQTNEDAIGRFVMAMTMNRFWMNPDLSDDDLKDLAIQFFKKFEGKKGITITREEYAERTKELLLKIKTNELKKKTYLS